MAVSHHHEFGDEMVGAGGKEWNGIDGLSIIQFNTVSASNRGDAEANVPGQVTLEVFQKVATPVTSKATSGFEQRSLAWWGLDFEPELERSACAGSMALTIEL